MDDRRSTITCVFWQSRPVTDRVLWRGADASGPRNLGALCAPAISLDRHRTDAARVRPQHSGFRHRPCDRRAPRRHRCSATKRTIRRSSSPTGCSGRTCKWTMYAVLVVSWVHGCIGIYFWVRMKPYFRKNIVAAARARRDPADAVPARPLSRRPRRSSAPSAAPEWRAENLSRDKVGTVRDQAHARAHQLVHCLYGYFGLIGSRLSARGVRAAGGAPPRSRSGCPTGNSKTVRVPMGLSVLEASTALQRSACPASAAGGHAARPAASASSATAARCPSRRTARPSCWVGSAPAGSVHPPCLPATSPNSDVSFFQICSAAHDLGRSAATIKPALPGRERYLVSMFVDMRGSTKLAEQLSAVRYRFHHQPLPRRRSRRPCVECGGQPNQFVGDGHTGAVRPLHRSDGPPAGRRSKRASRIAVHVDALNEFLGRRSCRSRCRFGIGIHGGEVIIGDIGSEATPSSPRSAIP